MSDWLVLGILIIMSVPLRAIKSLFIYNSTLDRVVQLITCEFFAKLTLWSWQPLNIWDLLANGRYSWIARLRVSHVPWSRRRQSLGNKSCSVNNCSCLKGRCLCIGNGNAGTALLSQKICKALDLPNVILEGLPLPCDRWSSGLPETHRTPGIV